MWGVTAETGSQVTPNLFLQCQATGSASSRHRSQVKQTLKDLLPAPHLTQEETKAQKTECYGQLYLPRCRRWGPQSRAVRDQDRARPACIWCVTHPEDTRCNNPLLCVAKLLSVTIIKLKHTKLTRKQTGNIVVIKFYPIMSNFGTKMIIPKKHSSSFDHFYIYVAA